VTAVATVAGVAEKMARARNSFAGLHVQNPMGQLAVVLDSIDLVELTAMAVVVAVGLGPPQLVDLGEAVAVDLEVLVVAAAVLVVAVDLRIASPREPEKLCPNSISENVFNEILHYYYY
jgi:hypothetical protein